MRRVLEGDSGRPDGSGPEATAPAGPAERAPAQVRPSGSRVASVGSALGREPGAAANDSEPVRLLVVEDNPSDAMLLEIALERGRFPRFEMEQVSRLTEALDRLHKERVDVAIVDLGLPDAFQLEALDQLVAEFPDVPIVVMTGNTDEELAMEAVRRGAQGYLIKGEAPPPAIVRSILHAIERHALLRALEESRARERHMATHDPLTGLPNRALFGDRLGQAVGAAARTKRSVAVLFVDLDHFKEVNDNFGHDVGDIYLKSVAQRIQKGLRASDTLARFGGDEFVVLCTTLGQPDDAELVAEKIVGALEEPIDLGGASRQPSASIGIAVHPRDGESAGDLLRSADQAMYEAKQSGRGRYCVFQQAKRKAH